MISVEEALAQIIALTHPVGTEDVALGMAAGRVLRRPVTATRDQPPFAAAKMDGYAVADPVIRGDVLRIIGEAAAGHRFSGRVSSGAAVRIFTGAPVPDGAKRIIIQENVTRGTDTITLDHAPEDSTHIRDPGLDFRAGDIISAPRRLRPVDLAHLAAMNCGQVTVSRKPDIAIIATGDELVMPGDAPGEDQIIASNIFALKAMAEAEGASARILPIARDTKAALHATLDLAQDADMIVTVGGASVGDHDLVAPALDARGATRVFHKVAMRPGKPLMAGRMGDALLLGLPGNPVSAIICGHIFLRPALRALLGLGGFPLPSETATLETSLPPNGPRAHYMRASLGPDRTIRAFPDQDSSRLGILCHADALLVRPAHDPAREAGEQMRYILL